MRVTVVGGTNRSEHLRNSYLGYYPLNVLKELLGRESIKTSRSVTREHMDLGLLDFIMTGPKVPGVNKYTKVHAPLGTAAIKGEGSARGVTNKVEHVAVAVENGTTRTTNLARIALNIATGFNGVHLKLKYDGGLVVPDNVKRVHASADGVFASLAHIEEGVIFGDPYLPHPDANEYPNLYGNTPEPKLMDNDLFVASNAGNVGEAYVQAAVALEQSTDREQTYDSFLEMIAIDQGMVGDELKLTLAIAGTDAPIPAARKILALAAL